MIISIKKKLVNLVFIFYKISSTLETIREVLYFHLKLKDKK